MQITSINKINKIAEWYEWNWGKGSVMKNTVINTSKEMTAYSDFPPPKEAANFMHHSQLLEYLR